MDEKILRTGLGVLRMENELNMTVSPVCSKNGEKYAFVSFSDGERSADGKIPDCKITFNKGFTDEEVAQLELYMKMELGNLKKMAAGVGVMDAFLK